MGKRHEKANNESLKLKSRTMNVPTSYNTLYFDALKIYVFTA